MSVPLRREAKGSGDSRLTRLAVAMAMAGNQEGVHYLYVRYAGDVRRYVTSFVRDRHEAEDVTQTIFAELTTAIQEYEQQGVPFRAWIVRVARNAALDHLRAKRATPTGETPDASPKQPESISAVTQSRR